MFLSSYRGTPVFHTRQDVLFLGIRQWLVDGGCPPPGAEIVLMMRCWFVILSDCFLSNQSCTKCFFLLRNVLAVSCSHIIFTEMIILVYFDRTLMSCNRTSVSCQEELVLLTLSASSQSIWDCQNKLL